MSKQIKKRVISLVAGLAIIAGTVTTAVILANLANRNIKSFIVEYDKLLEIRNRILSDYSKNASIDNQCTIDEFVNKVNDGSLKTWINDNFKEYFKSVDSNTAFDFNLRIEQTDNEILLTLTPSENQTLRLDQFSNKYDASIVEFNKNSVVFKFPKSEFLKQQLFSYEQLNLFQSKLIADMQKNKLTFENLQTISDTEQKTQIIDWVSNSLGIQNIFSEIDFQKLPAANDTYSITLITNNDYVLGWANNEKDTTDFIIQRKSITINFNKIIKIENEHLIQLKDAINVYLQQKNIDYLTWIEHFDKKDQIYQEFLDFIYNKLDTLMNNSLTNGCIGSLEILDNGNDVYSLKIIPNIGYSFLSDSIYYDNGIILLTDIEIYSYIEFAKNNIDEFVERIQQTINLNKYSPEQFRDWIETDEFKEFIGANLKTSNNINIDINKIKNISYDIQNNILTISPESNYKFKLLETVSNISVNENGELLISSLNLFEYIHFTKLIELFNGVQQFIDQYKITAKEFREYIDDKNNWNNLKTLISQSLFISENDKINLDKLLSFRFENNNLLITLDTNYTIYSADSYANVSLIANTLTVKNLVYFNTVDLVKLNDLFNVIQTLIDNHKYTISEFNQYINDNFDSFKTLIASNLFVNENDTILETEITNITFENGLLRISLNNDYIKYNLEQNDNFELDNTDLLIKNLNYYNEINFDNLDNLFNAIQNQIKNSQYTIDEFENYLSTDTDSFKQLIVDNLYISDTEKLTTDKITKISFDANTNQLNIELDNTYLKYTITTNSNITLVNTTLTISNLQYYTLYNFVDIDQLFNAIQDYIDVNKLNNDEFLELTNTTNNDAIRKLVEDNLLISTTTTLPVDNIIEVKLNDSYQLEITLNDQFVKYAMPTDANVNLNNNLLTIANLEYSESIELLNIDELYEYINNLVVSNQFTPNEFKTYINNNLTTLKTEIASKLLISTNQSLDENEIISINMNANNCEISINGLHKKYIVAQNSNVTVVNNKDNAIISIKNLDLYTSIKFTNLASIRSNLQKIVTDNCYSSDDFNRYISNNQSSLKTMISNSLSKSIDGPGSWSVSQINRIEYSGGNVKIYFSRPSNYKYSFESYSYGSFANDVLTISSFSYYSPSPTNYFNWNGSKITGLTSAGKSQSMLAIPTSCTAIGEYAFRSANNLRTLIVPGTVKRLETAAIEKCANLSSVELKEGVTDIGSYAFGECNSLRSIYLPNSVTAIRTFAFNKCTNLNTFSLDYKNSRLGLIEQQAFNECLNLSSVTLPENRIEIQYKAFDCEVYNGFYNLTLNYYIYSTNIKVYDSGFYTFTTKANFYFYGLTNPNNITLEGLVPFNAANRYAYVKNNDIKNKLSKQFNNKISLL